MLTEMLMRVKMEMLMRAKTEKILMQARAKISMHAYINQNASTNGDRDAYVTNVDATAKGNVEKYRKENYDEYIDNLKIQK